MNHKSPLFCLALLGLASQALAIEPRGSLTIGRIAAIKHPSDATWSPDGKRIAFLWDAAGIQNLFVVTPGQEPVTLTDLAPDPDDLTADIGHFEWLSSQEILFAHDGDLWKASASGQPVEKTGFTAARGFTVSRDKRRVAFVRDGRLVSASIDGNGPETMFVDPDRIGVWGLSYGGFLTLQALTMTPSPFRCGIDVAGVTDWATWGLESNGGWITGRMSTPEENPDGYHRTAPRKHMGTLERPLLILHGTADVNVAFRESLNLIDVLLKMNKDFDFEVYPGELHFFRREHILRDAWRRAERFFDDHLKNGRSMPSH